MKACSKCGEMKPLIEFSKHRGAKDGLAYWCKACCSVAAHAYRKNNPEKVTATNAAYYAANKATKVAAYLAAKAEDIAARHRAYCDAHADEIAAWRREHYAANARRILAEKRAYALANPAKRAANERNRKARKKGNGGMHTAEDVQAQYDRQEGRCYYCRVEVGNRYHVDHRMPLALGGSNGPENIVVACPTCNVSKGAKHPQQFVALRDVRGEE